jgi:sacsin
MLDLLQDFIIPAWESQILDSWTSPCKEETAERILRQFHSLRSDCRKSIASLHIVPVARIDGEKAAKFETAARLIDPSIQSLRDLFFGHEEVCPRKAFINKYKGVLIDCGLKTALDEELVEDRVRCFGDGCHTAEDVKIRASRLLQSAPTWKREPHGHRNSVLREIQWLPAADKHGTLLLRSADQCRGIEDRLLVDHVFPVVRFEISRDWRKHLGWDESISDSILHAQLRKGVEQADRMVVNAVLTYIKKKGLDNYGSLMDIPCILTSDGHFDYPRRTFRTGCEMLKPYLRNVDSGFWKEHSQLLGQFGMKNKPALEDLLKIQEELHTPLNESDTTVMIEIIKLSANFPRDSLSSLKIPDTAGQLCAIQEITFDDFGLYTVIDAFSSTHPGIPRSIALKLGIEPLSERVKKGGLGLADVDDDDEFDQREEVATGIADTLERYPVETTFKEYLANADDVGTAHQINWLLDNRNHPKGSLLTPELSDMQGPALMVHNDGSRWNSKLELFETDVTATSFSGERLSRVEECRERQQTR